MVKFLFVLLLFCVAFLGCSKGTSLVQVTGKVLVDNQPASGASVLFHPSAENGITASGTADADGNFSLTSNMQPGIASGHYKVTVIWPDPKKQPSDEDVMMGRAKDPPDLLKGRFAARDRSTLTMEVEPGTTLLPTLQLQSK